MSRIVATWKGPRGSGLMETMLRQWVNELVLSDDMWPSLAATLIEGRIDQTGIIKGARRPMSHIYRAVYSYDSNEAVIEACARQRDKNGRYPVLCCITLKKDAPEAV